MPEGEAVERGERDTVVPLELFFDLVFVFAFTQVTTLLSGDATWGGVLRAGLLLSLPWWAGPPTPGSPTRSTPRRAA